MGMISRSPEIEGSPQPCSSEPGGMISAEKLKGTHELGVTATVFHHQFPIGKRTLK